ncbi:MAG: hypothetical protein P1V35_17025 [Planctomycetota bacterium]|nr:hypothetical protein [Planctomycetota bacterium]
MREQLNLTEQDGYEALQGHLAERAFKARKAHPDLTNEGAIRRLMADPEVVRFPTAILFDTEFLIPGEFAHAEPRGDQASDGFVLVIHPHFKDRWEDLQYLVAYHIPSINYLDVATHREAEMFGALLTGMEKEAYYQKVCELADELGPVPGAEFLTEAGPGSGQGASGCCGGGCS